MGRPPAWSSCQSPTRPWAPPSNAQGAGSSRGAASQSSGRHFVVPIPSVPAGTAKAIRQALAGTSSHPFAAQQNRIRTLTAKLREQREKAKTCQQKIAELETQKEQGLRDIRETRQQETANTIATLERKLKNRYNKDLVAARAAWQEQIDAECEVKRQAWKVTREAKREAPIDDDSTEPAKKRIKMSDSSTAEAPQNSEGEVTDVVTAEASVVPHDPAIEIRSDALKQELTEAEATLEKLNGTRTEMIWLLKQVIKAEEKQKDDINKRNATKT